ncbi:MAG TPA: hypothetical protein VI540_10040 [Gaiellaceae bacterium]|nr:hypothetical protein [Gaiellaceae bacterium]
MRSGLCCSSHRLEPTSHSTQPGFPCYDPLPSRSGLQLVDLAVLHELLHTIGFVPTCAPHHARAVP